MISNNSSYKLKASKSSDFQENQLDENLENESVDGDATGDSHKRYNVYNSRDLRYKGVKPRQSEYKSYRGVERRGTRGRSGVSGRRNERDFTDGGVYVISRKYQDSLNRNSSNTGMYHHSKYYESEKKVEIKFNLPEDTRISKLLRRLNIEEDQENSLTISKKLLEVLLIPDNALYVRKAFHILRESMLEILHIAPGPLAKCQAARALGRMGYIMGQENDFDRFQIWLFSKVHGNSENLTYLFMKAVQEVLALERKKPVLQKHSSVLMRHLMAAIEITDNVDVFKTGLEDLVDLIELYPDDFYPLFRDTIDLLFGWHVDHTQQLSNIEFISKCLQRLSKYFKVNLEFSVTLILHFLEDIEGYSNQLHKKDEAETDADSAVEHVTVFILALNTVLKCLGESFNPNNEAVTVKFITECLMKIIQTSTDALESFVPDNLTIAGNECISILLSVMYTKPTYLSNAVLSLVDLELSLVQEFSNSSIVSMMLMISKVIKELSANLPIELISKLLGPDSEIIKMRQSPYVDVQEATICVYQSLLNLKNIPLLQEAYKYILGDLELVYKCIVPNISDLCQNNPFTQVSCELDDAENTVLFLLRCLSQLANVSGSIIGMWALKPSILELLGVLLEPYNKQLLKVTPALQYSLLYLLFSHCKCYNYFISSSTLVTDKINIIGHLGLPESVNIDDVGSKSPNSGNFAIVLNVLFKTLIAKPSTEVIILILHWFSDILRYSESYLEVLHRTKDFTQLAELVLKYGYIKNDEIVLCVAENLQKLLNNKHLSWKNSFLVNVNELCALHMTSNNSEIRKQYTKLSANVPWDIAVKEFGKMFRIDKAKKKYSNLCKYNNYTVVLAQHLHMYGSVYGEMLPFQFKIFMSYILKNQCNDVNWLEDIFLSCWPLESDTQASTEQFRDLALSSRAVLYNWATWEAAQFCVNTKLRTPLGKPNETLTSFEVSLKQLAKNLSKLDDNQMSERPDAVENRVRLFLQFMDHLEVSIYNASEGSAIAIPQPSKPVRTFFTTNSSTCREWLSRIRLTVIQLALHVGQSAFAVRHGHILLKDLSEANKVSGSEFAHAAMYVTWALLNLRESDALQGLYVWCKKASGKEFTWIKCSIDQANRKYEVAAEGYANILRNAMLNEQDASLKSIDAVVKRFISEQVVNCYKQICDWYNILTWKNEEVFSYLETDFYSATDFNCVQALFNIDIGNHSFNELTTWTDDDELKTRSSYDVLSKVEANVYGAALNILAVEHDVTPVLDSNSSRIQQAMQTELLSLPSELLQSYCVLNYVVNGLKNILVNAPASSSFLVSENFESEVDKIDSSILFKILWWSEYFGKLQNQGFSMFCCNLRLNVIKKARKEKNFNVAANQLYKFLQEKDMLYVDGSEGDQSLLVSMGNSLVKKIPDLTVWYPDTAKAVYEAIKLLYDDSDNRQLTFNLCAITSTSISKCADMFQNNELHLFSSKILLKLASWLQTNDHVSITDLHSHLGKFLTVLPEIGIIEKSNVIPVTEMAIGKLLQFSVHQSNEELAKAWNAFGTWCYRWGRKVVDSSTELTNVLTDEDQQAIQTLLLPDTKTEDLQRIYLILSQTRVSVDDEDIDSTEINTSEMIRCQLQNVPVLFNARESDLQTLVQIWRNIHKRVYTYYELSAEAYFKYLHLAANSENITESTESNTVTVTLRLLRLIVKHALELQNVLEEGLATTPTHPWKIIIPQLFSRLNHPESYVRQRVSELLCRIAEDSPHLIMFPAVVGALEGGVEFDFSEISLPKDCLSQNNENTEDTEDEIDDAYDSENDDSKNILQSCFKSMVDTLSKQAPETINEVQVLVKELRRIILLWDELWLGTLAQHHSEINKKQQHLELEIEKVVVNANLTYEEKVSLITEKHRIIIKPIIFILEQLYDITSVEPETPHEKQFQEQYSGMIVETLGKLKHPDNMDKPQESWQLLKQLQSKFQQKVNKRASYTLKMQEISPVLANMRNTVIAMPGLVSSSKTRVTISHVSNHVSILPTKTKPKKLIFHGSNGQTYTYLFKGLEDLHLDERIMQFLSITNTMMAKSKDGVEYNLYRARFYSVIPLGPRSGLISWVDGTTPVFALYKRWQQREATKHNAKSNSSSNLNVLRPSELFYNKLNPLLQEHGVKNIENRKEWPLVVLKQVLTELMNETPSDLLAKELWCHSINAGTWLQMVRRYSYSVAVMSIIGYIIGLGDRHLDNVLVDLTSGDVVHIDYNVCFEKGKALRVPEKVPFRLTPNIRDALGVTGIEGIFRMACENVLKTMKKGRETLLTLLEAFVYDPLIDWTLGVEGLAGTIFGSVPGSSSSRQTRKNLEREVTLAMFNVRCAETKVDWNDNKKDILEELPELTNHLEKWMNQYKKCTEIEDLLQDLHQQMALVKEAEANGICKHPLYSLPSRYDTYRKTQDAINNSKKDLENLIKDCDSKSQKYIEALRLLESQQISQWSIELNTNFEIENNTKVFNLVKEFLQNAGQSSMITQCEQSEKEVGQLSQQQLVLTMKCLHLLQEYALVIHQCPPLFLERHRVNVVSNWCKYLLESENVNACDAVFQQFCQFIDPAKYEINLQSVAKFSYQLSLLYNETATHLAKVYDDLNKVRSDESMLVAEKIYNEAKTSIVNFLRHEKGAPRAFEFVIVSELLLLNQSFLSLETAASRRGDWLMKLTSRDGIWFLDDLTYSSNKSMELLSYLHMKQNSKVEDPRFFQILNGLKSANNMYKSLQELNYNFHTIILPESMKKIQCDDGSVLGIIADLNAIISNVGRPLNDVVSYLENNLKCIVMEMDVNSTGDFVLEKVAELKMNYDALLQSQSELLSPGKMLLMGFNGLFQKLNLEYDNLINTLESVEIPPCWRNLDQVKEAKSLAAPIFNTRVRAVLDDIFIIKRLQAMSDFFNVCLEMCQSFKGKTYTIFNDEQIIKPVRKFIADYISRQFLGITTEAIAYIICLLLQDLGLDVTNEIEQKDIGAENKVPVDELYQKGWSLFVKHGIFTQNILAQASSLETNLKTAWEKIQEPKKLEQNLALLQSSVIRIQHQITTYNWMFEDHLLNQRNWLQNMCTVNRSKFILDLQNESTALNTVQLKLAETREQQKPLVSSISQRLKWAAGANPDLNEILSNFETALSTREKKLDAEQQIANIILTTCTNISHHEMLRSPTSDSKLFDQLFLSSCDKWRVACQFKIVKLESVSSVEENIMRLYSPDMIKNPKWLSIISEKISDIITGTQNELEDLRNSKASIVEDILVKLEKIKLHYAQHCKLMTDFKPLIKSMAKIEEHSLNSQQFIADYRKYIEHFTNLLHEIKKDMSKNDVENAMKNLYYLSECTQRVYDKLMSLMHKETEKSFPRPPLVRQDEISLSPLKSMTPKQESLTRGQQRNAYAVGVWRRVRLKLEGRDPDPGRKYTTQEQVDYVIRESTNLDNLALLYEGWTPWV